MIPDYFLLRVLSDAKSKVKKVSYKDSSDSCHSQMTGKEHRNTWLYNILTLLASPLRLQNRNKQTNKTK